MNEAEKFIAKEERKREQKYGYVPKLHPSEWMNQQTESDWKDQLIEQQEETILWQAERISDLLDQQQDIRADEREACAKLADAASEYNRFISIEIATAIRARNN